MSTGASDDAGYSMEPDWAHALGNVPVRVWFCPVPGHSDRTDPRGGPVVTVEWDGDVARCTAPGCGRTSGRRRSGQASIDDMVSTIQELGVLALDFGRVPRPEDIRGADIAHALSMLCRYGGHSRAFFSVAEHCVLMSYAVAPENALWALLHDAAEAYVQDVVRPVKRALPEYQQVEDRIMGVICDRFGLGPVRPAEVTEADTRILLDERAAVMVPSSRPWASLDGVEPLGVHVEGWAPRVAEKRYRQRLTELTGWTDEIQGNQR